MAVDTNTDATSSWTLLKTGPTTEPGTIDYKGFPYEITTHGSVPPDTKEGRKVGPGGRSYTLASGENLYGRTWRALADDKASQVIVS